MSKFYNRLKDLRLEKGLSIDKLAKETNLNLSSLCRWELGQADIKSTQIIILARYFNVLTDYLLGLNTDYLKNNENK